MWGTRGHNFPGAESLRKATKSPNNVTSTFFSATHLLPKDLRFQHGGAKLASCPGHHLTSLRAANSWRFCAAQLKISLLRMHNTMNIMTTCSYFDNNLTFHAFDMQCASVPLYHACIAYCQISMCPLTCKLISDFYSFCFIYAKLSSILCFFRHFKFAYDITAMERLMVPKSRYHCFSDSNAFSNLS